MLQIVSVEREKFLDFVETQPYRNFLQYPSWADLKSEWKWIHEFLGWVCLNEIQKFFSLH
ncbi:peptidoglycan bridge formation glycyltransferase FemA/FemB family protein [Thermoactinomyces vulgaris]|nr:peptidoglycan bridge formation glycyltransferase FemA/FemB family protein [Thermoactinomyces vulgaris]